MKSFWYVGIPKINEFLMYFDIILSEFLGFKILQLSINWVSMYTQIK